MDGSRAARVIHVEGEYSRHGASSIRKSPVSTRCIGSFVRRPPGPPIEWKRPSVHIHAY
jgi:hypothetical protein